MPPSPPIAANKSTSSTRSRAGAATVRKAKLPDAVNLFDLINSLSGDGTLLRRGYAEICENVRDFALAESEAGIFLGCGALHLYGPHLAEVRSIVVKPEAKGQGTGGKLLRALLSEAEEQNVTAVCLFTRIPDFFFHFGFRVVDRTGLPDKIYKDCQTCPRLYACDEAAMVRGPLPKIAVLGPSPIAQLELVKLQTGAITPPDALWKNSPNFWRIFKSSSHKCKDRGVPSSRRSSRSPPASVDRAGRLALAQRRAVRQAGRASRRHRRELRGLPAEDGA
ncbi:MAG: GNAT family N-acetyltransferase [Acidobacteriaceae bacterium]